MVIILPSGPFSLVAVTLNLRMALPPEKRACVRISLNVSKWVLWLKKGVIIKLFWLLVLIIICCES